MRQFPLQAIVVALGLVAGGPGAGATEPAPAPAREDVAAIRQALERIATALETQQKRQDLDLVFRRIDLSLQETLPQQTQLRALDRAITYTTQEIEDQDAELQRLRDQQEAGTLPAGETEDMLAAKLSAIDGELARRRRELGRLKLEAEDLRTSLAASDAERAEWKKLLDQEIARLHP